VGKGSLQEFEYQKGAKKQGSGFLDRATQGRKEEKVITGCPGKPMGGMRRKVLDATFYRFYLRGRRSTVKLHQSLSTVWGSGKKRVRVPQRAQQETEHNHAKSFASIRRGGDRKRKTKKEPWGSDKHTRSD